MRIRNLAGLLVVFVTVAISYGTVNAQVVGAIKDTANKTKDVAVDPAKKTANVVTKTEVVVTDSLDKTKDSTVDAAKTTSSTSKKIGNYSINVSENIAGTAYEGGRWLTVTTWDGTKWVSKRAWFKTKKAADETKKVISQP